MDDNYSKFRRGFNKGVDPIEEQKLAAKRAALERLAQAEAANSAMGKVPTTPPVDESSVQPTGMPDEMPSEEEILRRNQEYLRKKYQLGQ